MSGVVRRKDGGDPHGHLGWQSSDCVTCGVEAGEPCKPGCEAETSNCDCPTHREDVPELLQAAEAALNEIEKLLSALPDETVRDYGPVSAMVWGDLRAAIAKAKGEEVPS